MITKFVHCKPIMIDEKQLSMGSSFQYNGKFELQVLSVLETTDGYGYRSKYKNIGSSRYVCKQNKFQRNNIEIRERERVRCSIREFPCKGYVEFFYSLQAVATTELFHCISHERIREFPNLTAKDAEKVNNLAVQGLFPFQIRQQLTKKALSIGRTTNCTITGTKL